MSRSDDSRPPTQEAGPERLGALVSPITPARPLGQAPVGVGSAEAKNRQLKSLA